MSIFKLAISGLATMLMVATSATAAGQSAPSGTFVEPVPDYCTVPKNGTQAQKARIWKKLGKAGIGKLRGPLVGHFCIALKDLYDIRSGKYKEKIKTGADAWARRRAQAAIGAIGYYERRLPEGHWMLGEVHRAYAQAYTVLGDRNNASEHEALAAGFSPPPSGGSRGSRNSASANAYVKMADRMMAIGLPGEAVKLLELAKRVDPDSQMIEIKLEKAKTKAAEKATQKK
jgi:hypothetical protein